jgi:hypothetical protein
MMCDRTKEQQQDWLGDGWFPVLRT